MRPAERRRKGNDWYYRLSFHYLQSHVTCIISTCVYTHYIILPQAFHTLRNKHHETYKKSLQDYSSTHAYEQEQRQTRIETEIVNITVNVAREDFPSISADIPVSYRRDATQSGWAQFIKDVRRTLDLEYIEIIIDRRDGQAVHRIQRLFDGGEFFVRVTETSAVVEALITHKTPIVTHWEVTKYITSAHDEVVWHEGTQYYHEALHFNLIIYSSYRVFSSI